MAYDGQATVTEAASAIVNKQGAGNPQYQPRQEGTDNKGYRLSHLKKLAEKLNVVFSPMDDAEAVAFAIATNCDDAAIDAAHAEIVAGYQKNGKRGNGRRKHAITIAREKREAEERAKREAEASETHEQAEGDRDFGERYETTASNEAAQVADNAAEMTEAERKLKALQDLFGGGASVTRAEIETMITEAVAKITRPKLIEIKQAKDLPPIKLGVQHKNFPQLLAMCNARNGKGERLNVWLHGEASSGKSAGAQFAAKAMELPFYSVNALDQPYKLVGYKDANGTYHSTAFRKAVEHGGVFCFDEYDRSHPGVVIEMNNFLSTGEMWFPDCVDAPIKRHPDCVIIATGNTAGMGATAEYNTAQKQDASARTRFVFLEWQIDEALESGIASNAEWCATVQSYRKAARAANVRGFDVSTRATFQGEALLAAGMTQSQVIDACIRCGLDDAAWKKVKALVK